MTVTITPAGAARFTSNCTGCVLRSFCTTATGGRVITLHPHHDLLTAARAFADTEEFTDPYRRHRPMVERSIAWMVRGANRRLRYRGTERNRLWLAHRAAAIDLARLIKLGLAHTPTGWTIA